MTEDFALINEVYSSLKYTISHKGFNDYFKPLKRLGKGAYATVYLIQHKFTKQKFAAKVFSRQAQKVSFEGYQSLQNEVRMLRELRHPNIIRYQGTFQTDHLVYVVTEYLQGGTLQMFAMNRVSTLGDYIVDILRDMLSALDYLHGRNVMHRDLKPQNILLRESDKKWVIVDLGLGAFTKENYLFDKCGTMGYMAPQINAQNRAPQSYSTACDIFSMGVIAFNLFVGELPFRVQMETMFTPKIVWQGIKKKQCE